LIYHDAKDTKHWHASSKRAEALRPLGVNNIRTFVNPEDATRVGLVADVADLDTLLAAMKSDKALADAMADDGVLPETLVVLVESQRQEETRRWRLASGTARSLSRQTVVVAAEPWSRPS
jgi:hypothetical protein